MKSKVSFVIFCIILVVFFLLYKNTGNKVPLKKEEEFVTVFPENSVIESQEETELEKPIIQKTEEVLTKPTTKVDKIIAIAKESTGAPYKAAGTTKKGFDCSGLVMTSFKKEGVVLPRASYEMAKKGKQVTLKTLKKGDLVFFKTNTEKPNKISHVGLVTSIKNGEISFIHSTTKQGVIISSMEEEYYKKSFCKAKRIL